MHVNLRTGAAGPCRSHRAPRRVSHREDTIGCQLPKLIEDLMIRITDVFRVSGPEGGRGVTQPFWQKDRRTGLSGGCIPKMTAGDCHRLRRRDTGE